MEGNDYDTLEDINLDGVNLVGDDPTEWRFPPSMREAESVLEWWRNLCRDEDMASRVGITADTRRLLLSLAVQYESLAAKESGEANWMFAGKRRSVLVAILRAGLNTSQVAVLLGVSRHQVVRELYFNQHLSEVEVNNRIRVEEMLRAGYTCKQIMGRCGLAKHHVEVVSNSIGVKPKAALKKSDDVRERVLDLKSQGIGNKQIIEMMAEDGHVVSSSLICNWVRRHGNRDAA